ncbi:PaaI family thioesterase [Oceaniglobus ichthyenteri]|uniref:PaaI family thioesterase n=1 Tax=Oceaniglobus ichthyenteri TaxID=2136177 RepID=UPI000D34C9EA|nr:PaaI family thioesterase [Oceaniglobus ichthyenteri]
MFFATSPDDLPSRDKVLSMSGMAFMEAVRDGRQAGPPIGRLMNCRVSEVDPGRVVFTGTPGFDHMNPVGGIHGGWYGTVLDSCMGCAVMTKVAQGSIYTTLEYKININRAIPAGTDILATGWVVHAGRSTAVAHGEIRNAKDDTLYASGSTTCLIMAIPG